MADGRSLSNVDVRKMIANDVAEVASLHRQIFSDYFLTHMGQRFLERYYKEFVDQSENYGFVAVNEDVLLGFVVGMSDSERFYSRFYRRNFALLVPISLWRLAVDPYVRRHIWSRMSHGRRALRSLFGRARGQDSPIESASQSRALARLLSVGVRPECRGQGVADALVGRFCEHLQEDGFEIVGLSVRSNNNRAISFYKKNGWQQERSSETVISFVRSTST